MGTQRSTRHDEERLLQDEENDDDYEEVVLNGKHHGGDNDNSSSLGSTRKFFIGVLVLFMGFVLFWSNQEQSIVTGIDAKDTATVTAGGSNGSGGPEKVSDKFSVLSERLAKAKIPLMETLKEEYGNDLAKEIFNKDFVYSLFRLADEESRNKLKRRMMIRLLEGSLFKKSSFVWVTAGHSAAAGHGNLFNQSYTARLEEAAAPIFESVGVVFQAKNYAMGGYSSGPELALCMQALFGPQIDALTWDFGMTDGHEYHLYRLWLNRAMVHPTKPVLFLNFDNGRRHEMFSEFKGIAGLSYTGVDVKLFPDSAQPENNPASLAPGVAYYRCKNEAENQEPCIDHKFNTNPPCEGDVKGQVKWHPGWKAHLLNGRVFAYFLTTVLEEAVEELAQSEETSVMFYHTELWNSEREDLKTFLETDLPTDWPKENGGNAAKIDFSRLYRSKVFCSSAILPNEARYAGLVTDNKAGTHLGGGLHTDFDLGVPSKPEPNPATASTVDKMAAPWLVQDVELRQDCPSLEIDYKDYFMVRQKDGLMSRKYPNDAELLAFGKKRNKTADALAVLCTKECPWGRCDPRHVGLDELPTNVTVYANGMRAMKTSKLGDRCHVLKASKKKKGKDTAAQHEIRFAVGKREGTLFLSSVIILI